MRLAAAIALASGFVAVPMVTAGTSAASPWEPCDSASCVPYVSHDAAVGESCTSGASRFVFGLDSSGRTLICPLGNKWVASEKQLIGVRTARGACDEAQNTMAQSPDGTPMSCVAGGWQPDYDAVYYS